MTTNPTTPGAKCLRITIHHQDNCYDHTFKMTFTSPPVLNILDQPGKMSNPKHFMYLLANAEYAFQIFVRSPYADKYAIFKCDERNENFAITGTRHADLKPFVDIDGFINRRTKRRLGSETRLRRRCYCLGISSKSSDWSVVFLFYISFTALSAYSSSNVKAENWLTCKSLRRQNVRGN